MLYNLIFFLLIISSIVLIILFVPLKVNISVVEGRLKVFFYKIKLIDKEIKVLFDIDNIEKTKKISRLYLKIIKKINYKMILLNVEGINYQYQVSPIYYAILHSIMPVVKGALSSKEIPYYYSLSYHGDSYIEFKSIIELHLGRLLLEAYKIRRIKNEGTSN